MWWPQRQHQRVALGSLRPTFSPMRLDEAALLLQALYFINIQQLLQGERPISAALQRRPGGRLLRYKRSDRREHWRTIRDVWNYGGGDCEDLAAAVAAEITVLTPWTARPIIYQVRPGLSHAVVQIIDGPMVDGFGPGTVLDPSRTGGMGEP